MARGELFFPSANEPKPAAKLEADLAGFGLYVGGGDLPVEMEFHLWPENCAVWGVWLAIQTQWYTDNGVRTGLNYGGVRECMSFRSISKKDRPGYFEQLQAMEFAALDEWAKQR